jgi:hypothetical protein
MAYVHLMASWWVLSAEIWPVGRSSLRGMALTQPPSRRALRGQQAARWRRR